MASAGAEPGTLAATPQVCPDCRRIFARLCDLNKHAKSHSRPFKCQIPSCKYHEYGWPTAKELERHINDKHSLAPKTYACHFQPCNYESKRESNCKQHMEKKHGWQYVRCKTNGRAPPVRQPTTSFQFEPLPQLKTTFPISPESNHHPTPVSSKPPAVSSFGDDFVLFDDPDHPMAVGHAGETLNRDYEDPQDDDSRVFIPWTSPTTRLLKNQSMLDMFTEAYNRPGKGLGHPDAMIDPSLRQYGQFPAPGWPGADEHKQPSINNPIKNEPPSLDIDRLSSNEASDYTGSAPNDSPSGRRNSSAAYSSQFHTPHTSGLDFSGHPAHAGQVGWTQHKPRRRDSEDDDQRPEKKLKSGLEDDFTDNNMPDIFRRAHPDIYDRDQKEKYSPCHSSHRDISTLVRHLGRPAHRLTVTKETISSFDIPEDDYPHPRIGVCRRCWRQFHQRNAFDEHVSGTCDKVSKGKREKWQVLYDSFTPLVDPAATLDNNPEQVSLGLERGEEPRRSPSRQSGFFTAEVDATTWADAAPSSSAPSPNMFFPPAAAPPTSGPDDALISMHEYERLQKEHNELQQRHRQLEKMAKELLISRTRQEAGVSGGSAQGSMVDTLMSGISAAAIPSLAGEARPRPAGARRPAASGPALGGASYDQDSLVLGMGPKPEDVDVGGLMNESHESLSRQNSGLSSSSRSTIHHVSNSPPTRPIEYEGDDSKGGNQPKETTPARKPPTSIPDSGYASNSNYRHGSFGEIGAMPGGDFHQYQGGHHRNSSSLSTVTYQHDRQHHPPSNMPDKRLPNNFMANQQDVGIQWRTNLFGDPTPDPTSAAGRAVAPHEQVQPQQGQHTFLPPGPQMAPGVEPSYDDYLNLEFYQNFGN